jgi:hypothetical protein
MVLGDYLKIWHFNSHGKGVQTIPFSKENKDLWLTLKGTTPSQYLFLFTNGPVMIGAFISVRTPLNKKIKLFLYFH